MLMGYKLLAKHIYLVLSPILLDHQKRSPSFQFTKLPYYCHLHIEDKLKDLRIEQPTSDLIVMAMTVKIITKNYIPVNASTITTIIITKWISSRSGLLWHMPSILYRQLWRFKDYIEKTNDVMAQSHQIEDWHEHCQDSPILSRMIPTQWQEPWHLLSTPCPNLLRSIRVNRYRSHA